MSLSFANNTFNYNDVGNETFGASGIILRIFFVRKSEGMSELMKLSYEVKF